MLSYDVCECGAPLQRVERETPTPKGTDVVLRVIAAGVCHSDLHIWDGYYDIGGGQNGLVIAAMRDSAGVPYSLYRVNLNNGAATLVGTADASRIGGATGPAVRGIAISFR